MINPSKEDNKTYLDLGEILLSNAKGSMRPQTIQFVLVPHWQPCWEPLLVSPGHAPGYIF